MRGDVAHLVKAVTFLVLAVATRLRPTVAPAAGGAGAILGALAVLHTLRRAQAPDAGLGGRGRGEADVPASPGSRSSWCCCSCQCRLRGRHRWDPGGRNGTWEFGEKLLNVLATDLLLIEGERPLHAGITNTLLAAAALSLVGGPAAWSALHQACLVRRAALPEPAAVWRGGEGEDEDDEALLVECSWK
jgi:hypothetical protein